MNNKLKLISLKSLFLGDSATFASPACAEFQIRLQKMRVKNYVGQKIVKKDRKKNRMELT